MKLSDMLTPALLKTTQPFIDGLSEMAIATVQDLILYYPRAHEDLSATTMLADAPPDEKVTIRGTVQNLKLVRTRSKKTLVQAQFIDESGGTAEVVWFNQPHVMRMLQNGQMVVLTGKVQEAGYKLKIMSPVFEDGRRETPLHAGRIVSVYPQTEKISSRWLREKIALVKPCIGELAETLPPEVIKEEKLMPRSSAVMELHFPTTPERLEEAKQRFAFEEMFVVQNDALERKKEWQGEKQKRL